MKIAALIAAAALSAACIAGGEDRFAGDLAVESGEAHGPRIRFNPYERPVADFPFPTDLLLTPDDTTATGARWNLSLERSSEHLSLTRQFANLRDGFGTTGPIFVPFSGRLDLASVTEETVYVVNVEPGHPREGAVAPLDLGRGAYPSHGRRTSHYGQDDQADHPDLLFPASNVADADGDGAPERVTHYEVASNTLILRPLLPLDHSARHVVLITRGVRGFVGAERDPAKALPVRSPFDAKAHAAQVPDVRRALELVGLEAGDLAYGWSFTTTDPTRPLRAMREGVWGRGPLARLSDLSITDFGEIRPSDIPHDGEGASRDHPLILQGAFLEGIMELLNQVSPTPLDFTFDNVAYIVFGTFDSATLRTGPRDTITINTHTGEGDIARERLPYLVAVPKTTERFKPPFPVAVYFHGTTTSRIEALGAADVLARQGIATIGFDQIGHGPFFGNILQLLGDGDQNRRLASLLVPVIADLFVPGSGDSYRGLDLDESLARLQEIGLFAEFTVEGRAEDTNGNGVLESSEGFFFADPARQCSSFQQDIVDFFQIVKLVRGLSGDALPGPGIDDPAAADADDLMAYMRLGDFDADGTLDLGGADHPIIALGTSLGGFHATLAAATEPLVVAAAPMVSGGIYSDIMVRTDMHSVTHPLFLEIFGELVVGCPAPDGQVWLTLGDDSDRCHPERAEAAAFANVPAPAPGTTVWLRNLDNGEEEHATVNEAGGFAVGVECDKGDRLEVVVGEGAGATRHEVVATRDGHALQRGSEDLRRILGIQQQLLDFCDAGAFASRVSLDPPPGKDPTPIFYLNVVGDATVPFAPGVQAARAAGALGVTREAWQPITDALVASGAMDGAFYDIDDARGDNPPDRPAIGPLPPLRLPGGGLTAIRWADVDGDHEFVLGHVKDGFNASGYALRQLSIFLGCRGRVLPDDRAECFLEGADCPDLYDTAAYPACVPTYTPR